MNPNTFGDKQHPSSLYVKGSLESGMTSIKTDQTSTNLTYPILFK